MKQYNYLRAIYLSFYSGSLYRDVARNWGKGVILYLMLVLSLCWLVLSIDMQPKINRFYGHFADQYISQIPQITIKDGVVKTPKNKPYMITNPDENSVIAVIDTTGKRTSLKPGTTKLLLTKDTLYYFDAQNRLNVIKVSPSWNIEIKPIEINQLIAKVVGWTWLIVFPEFLLLFLLWRLVLALIYALIGKIFAVMSDIPLRYLQVVKLSIVAFTPALIIKTLFDFFGVAFHLEWLFYIVVTLAYLAFAIRMNE